MTEIVLIPPASLLGTVWERKYQMLIPAGLSETEYSYYYKHFGKDPAYFVMMDNGMFEKPPLPIPNLVAMSEEYRVQELVLPDVWEDAVETLAQVRQFLEYWFNIGIYCWPPRFQAVVHGQKNLNNSGAVEAAAKAFVSAVAEYQQIPTVAISRSLSRSMGNIEGRNILAKWIHDNFPQLDIHYLGFDDEWHGEIKDVMGIVRSMDTVAPYTAAYAGKKLRDRPKVPRPPSYFSLATSNFDMRLVKSNIAYLDNLAHGKTRGVH